MDQPPRPAARPRKQQVNPEQVSKMIKDLNTHASTLRILEERYSLMRNKSQVSEQNIIELERGTAKDLKMINEEITDLKHELREVIDKLRLISAELSNMVTKDEFRVVDRYVEMWQPMNFVTREELAKLVQEKDLNRIADRKG